MRKLAAELVALEPDVILATGGVAVRPLAEATRTIPIVFSNTPDPVGAGFVESLSRPGGNITGFTQFEYGISVKWLELLKEIAPGVARVAVLSNFGATPGIGQLAAIQAVAPSLRVELTPLVVGDAGEIENAISVFGRGANGGLIVTTGTVLQINRDLIVKLAERVGTLPVSRLPHGRDQPVIPQVARLQDVVPIRRSQLRHFSELLHQLESPFVGHIRPFQTAAR